MVSLLKGVSVSVGGPIGDVRYGSLAPALTPNTLTTAACCILHHPYYKDTTKMSCTYPIPLKVELPMRGHGSNETARRFGNRYTAANASEAHQRQLTAPYVLFPFRTARRSGMLVSQLCYMLPTYSV